MSTTTTANRGYMTFAHMDVKVPESAYKEHIDLLNAAYALDSAVGYVLADLERQMDSLRRDLTQASVRVAEAAHSGASVGTVNTLGVIQGQGSMIDGLCARLGAYMGQVPTLRTLVLQIPGATHVRG